MTSEYNTEENRSKEVKNFLRETGLAEEGINNLPVEKLYFIYEQIHRSPDLPASGNELFTYREKEIIKLRYGLGDGYVYTTEEVGKIFRVTRERVKKIEAKGIRKLHRSLEEDI